MKHIDGKKTLVVADANTAPFAEDFKPYCYAGCIFPSRELVPDEAAVSSITNAIRENGIEYVIAVGSGTINDLCKVLSYESGIEYSVFATAPSMDGYCSREGSVIEGNRKISKKAHAPEFVLADLNVISHAPDRMVAAGYCDLLGKFMCLTDWRLASYLNNETVNEEVFKTVDDMTRRLVKDVDMIANREYEGIKLLVEGLVFAGEAMAIVGSSRPASGFEHHLSHFLEVEAIIKGEKVELHGIKVGLGTLASRKFYEYAYINRLFGESSPIYARIESIPSFEELKALLLKIGAPTHYIEIGVDETLLLAALNNAYKIRDRYTIAKFLVDCGKLSNVADYTLPFVK